MKKKDISRLLQRYLTGHQEGKDAYFAVSYTHLTLPTNLFV